MTWRAARRRNGICRMRGLCACVATGLVLACGMRLALAAGAASQVSAEVLSPLDTATLVVNQLLDRFAPNLAPRPPAGAMLRLPGTPSVTTGAAGADGAPSTGQSAAQAVDAGAPAGGEPLVNADGGMSVSVMGAATLAHMVTRGADGQVQVDFN